MSTVATLIAEIGSVTTRVTLVDTVAGELRLIGQAEVPSTYEPPYDDALVAVLQAAAEISEASGRQLLDQSSLRIPVTTERDGVDRVIAVTSAAGPMALVIAAVSSDISARSALHASRAVNATVLQTISLNDVSQSTAASGDYSWIERQVQRLIGLNPDAIMLTGGLEGGADDTLVRLAHMIGLTALSSRVDAEGQARQDVTVRPVLYAGNSHVSERVVESLSNRAEPIVVENLRPTLEHSNLEPARRALRKLYTDRILGRMPGLGQLRRIVGAPIRTTTDAASLITRFIAELDGRNVLALDVGSATTSIVHYSNGVASAAIIGATGSGYGIGTLLAERGPAAFMRWLPFPIDERTCTHTLLNKQIRPNSVPASSDDLLIDHAVAREALALALAALHDEQPNAAYDLVLASGGVLAHSPHPGMALLTILDALQPLPAERALDIYLDTLGLVNAAGALAFVDAEGAFSLIEQDLLRNMALATCVVAHGGKLGDSAVEATLKIVGGDERTLSLRHGQIGRIELAPGQTAQLRLKPVGSTRIGTNAAGATIETGPAEVRGSVLGVVIDARGRPLRLPQTPLERQYALWNALVALGAENGPMPYESAAPLPEAAELVTNPPIVEEPQDPTPTPPISTRPLDNDLDKLRQSVAATPKKRGMFGRK